jgi:hypothetical protein
VTSRFSEVIWLHPDSSFRVSRRKAPDKTSCHPNFALVNGGLGPSSSRVGCQVPNEKNYKTNSAMYHQFKEITILAWFKLRRKQCDRLGLVG